MTSSSPHSIQPTPFAVDYPVSPFSASDSYVTDAISDQHTPLVDAIFSALQEAAYEEQHLPSNGYGNWFSDHDSCFGGSWGDSFFSYSYDSDANGSGGSVVKTEDDNQMQAQYCESDFSYQEDSENHPTFDYNAGYESCIAYTESEEEVRPADSYGFDEMRFCEGIFGYWPCLFSELQQAYDEQ